MTDLFGEKAKDEMLCFHLFQMLLQKEKRKKKKKKITNDSVHICYKRLASRDPFDNIINMNFP